MSCQEFSFHSSIISFLLLDTWFIVIEKGMERRKIVHFVGIGGIGMSALARWFVARKWAVFGSDVAEGKITLGLKKQGLKVKIGHKKANLRPKTDLVIYSSAVTRDNPELKEARKRGISIFSFSEALGELTRHYETFAVAGAHGKSTTTSLLSLVLLKARWDPTVIVGTKLREFTPPADGSNFRMGKSNYLILEADEWKAAFLHYSPTYAIITNIDREHLDFYKNFPNIKKTFLKFIGNMRPRGVLVVNRDNKDLYALRPQIRKIAKARQAKVIWYSIEQSSPSLVTKLKKNLSIPGTHNLSNALAVYTLARHLNINEKIIFSALKRYRGSWRRFEYRGKLKYKILNTKYYIPVYDDYAHHPTEIAATLQAFREKFPKSHLICVFQPHQAKRLKLLFKEFTHAFNDADTLVLLPVYKVAGRDRVSPRYDSRALAKKIEGALYLSNPAKLPKMIRKIIIDHWKLSSEGGSASGGKIENYVVVMMGAGTIVEETDKLLLNF